MESVECNIQEIDGLIQRCIKGDDLSVDKLKGISQNFGFSDIEKIIDEFEKEKKFQNAHYFICEMYKRFDKNFAVEKFLNNGENFSPSFYWAGLHFKSIKDYGNARIAFEKGYKDRHWFCGKELSDLYMHGDFSKKLKGLQMRVSLAFAVIYANRGGGYYERFIHDRF